MSANRDNFQSSGDIDTDLALEADPALVELTGEMLTRLGEDPSRTGLRNTPERVARALQFLTSGYYQSAEEVVRDAVFEEDCNEMVVVRDIEFY